MKSKNLIITIIFFLIIAAGSFYGGTKYQIAKSLSQRRLFNGQFNNQGNTGRNGNIQNGNRTGVRPVSGQIISSDNVSITVKMNDGSTRIVILNDKTVINKADQATKADLVNGATVAVFGTANSDGSVTAENIQLNPNFQFNPNSPTTTP